VQAPLLLPPAPGDWTVAMPSLRRAQLLAGCWRPFHGHLLPGSNSARCGRALAADKSMLLLLL
jgi:hypothetical protein